MVKNKLTVLLSLLAGVILALTGFSSIGLAKSGELVVAEGSEIGQLDPHQARSMQDINYGNGVFDTLLRISDGEISFGLAESYRLLNDRTWEFKLRKGVRFHNGDPFTAKDAKFSIDRLLDPATKNPFRSLYDTIKEVSIISDFTINITTNQPDPLLHKRLSLTAWIVPSAYIEKHGIGEFLKKPFGTGPFQFVKWVKNDYLALEAFNDYWGGVPKIKKIITRPIPEAASRMAALELGEADIVTNVPPFLIPQLQAKKGIQIQSVPSGRIIFVSLNTRPDGQAALKNQKVRQALNYAVDKNAIIEKILMRSGVERATILTNYHFGFDPNVKPYPYDPTKAKALLTEAGYKDGFELDLVTPSGRYLMDKEVSEAISGMLNKVGIKTEIRVMETGNWIKAFLSRELKGAYMVGWGNMLFDAEGTFSNFLVEEAPACIYKTSVADQVEKLIKEARSEMNLEKRKGIYSEIQKLILEDAPMLFLYQLTDNYGVRDRVKGFKATGDEKISYQEISAE